MLPDPEETGAPETHPNKRVKIQTETLISPESSPSSKGKSKLEIQEHSESEYEYESINCCGICLCETGNGKTTTIIRGVIDCCDHYFCFICIMEWSKVESKCPMCKRRFYTITRPRKLPVFPVERVVNVPVRDQVYHYHGNVTTGPPDLYAQVQCNVCNTTSDDSLLLLCDLCDTAYHTYCVGLGATVPEGDWFCADCSLLRAEKAQSEIKTDCCTQSSVSGHDILELARHVSIREIVRESDDDAVESAPTGSVDVSDNSSRIGTRRQHTTRSSSNGLGSVGQNGVAGHAIKFNARTLGHCRNVHNKIRTLREHWNGIRNGSLAFSSGKVRNASIAQPKPVRGRCSDEPPSVSSSSQPVTSQSCNQKKPENKGLLEVEKAWKMMNMAKAIERDHDKKASSPQASKQAVKKISSSKEAGESSSRSISLKIEQHWCIQNVGPGSHIQSHAFKLDSVKLKGASGVEKSYPTACGPSCSALVSSKESQTSLQLDVCHGNIGLPKKKNSRASSTHSTSSIRSASTTTTVCYDKEICSSSSSIANPPKEELKVEKSGIKSKVEVECDAKAEIQSLVKLNLKILCRDKKLEVGLFKKIARLATHSILAACGLDARPGISSVPECVCDHVKEDKEVRKYNLMPNSCRECFFSFVKNVVNTILLDNS